MLDAIRNLGILKMIQEFPDVFSHEALKSVGKFLEQREKAIQKGIYGKLQFEPQKNIKNIGIFHNNKGTIRFIIEEPLDIDESWKYLFLKTAPNGTYITPTWKIGEDDGGISKINRTIDKYKTDNIWPKDIISIFISQAIEVGELNKDGRIVQKNFYDCLKWATKKYKLKVFSIKLDNNKYCADIPELLRLAANEKPYITYQTKKTKAFKRADLGCSLCHQTTELFPRAIAGAGLNIFNPDKPGFFPGTTKKAAGKAFPICAPCGDALYAAKFYAFTNLYHSISGHNCLIIPHLVQSNNKAEGLEIIQNALHLIKKDLAAAKGTEAGIIEDLADNRGIEMVSFLFGDVKGQSVQNIRKFLPDVLPSRLSAIGIAIHDINAICEQYPKGHPWKLKTGPMDGKLEIIRSVLGEARYKDFKGKRKPFKASSVDSLDLLEAIFMKKEYPAKRFLPEFSAKLSYDFLGAVASEKRGPLYVISEHITPVIAQMLYLLKFLDRLGVIKMTENKNLVVKYLEGREELAPLNRFFNEEATGIDNTEKQYAFLVGLLFGKLIAFQQRRPVANNALRWLKGLEIGSQDLMEIYRKTRNKLDEYSFQTPAWSKEMSGVAEAIGALGSAIGSNWILSRREVPYYFCLGQSLSGFYLPGKGNDSKSDDILRRK